MSRRAFVGWGNWWISVGGLCALIACGGAPGDGIEGPIGGRSAGGASSGAPGSSGTSAATAPNPDAPESPSECAESVPGDRLLRRLTRRELLNTYQVVFPQMDAQATVELPVDAQGSIRLSNDAATLMMGSQMAEAVLKRAEQVAELVTSPEALSTILPCAPQADAACAGRWIERYGSQLFRRPLTDLEEGRYLALYTRVSGRSDFATGLKWVLVALMQSPNAVYRTELGQDGQLTPYELASELSYNYSAGPPSPELIDRAVNGVLSDPQARVEEAKQLLSSPGGKQVVHQFFSEWLSYDQAASANRANAPDNFPTIRSKMVLETQRFLEDVVFRRQGSFAALFTANTTVVDTDLAAYYGLSGGSGDLFTGGGSEAARSHGLGIFAQGSVLTSMASVQITSPTRRGLLLLKRLFCQVPGLPQAINFDLTRSELQGSTTREKLENSHLAPGCKSCHSRFDPLGFAFEHFDHVGRYRTEEKTPAGSFPIDASTTVALLDNRQVTGQEQLVTLLAEDPEVLSCVSGTLERYVYGSEGRCRAKVARTRAEKGEVSILEFLADLAQEPHVVSRK